MPFFKTTFNILTKVDEDELFEDNWMDYDFLYLPPSKEWDYKKEMQIEDVDIWEVIYEAGGGLGVYAAWQPYAEFYMITTGWIKNTINDKYLETYYGKNASKKVFFRCKELGINLQKHKIWVDNEQMWLYE